MDRSKTAERKEKNNMTMSLREKKAKLARLEADVELDQLRRHKENLHLPVQIRRTVSPRPAWAGLVNR